MDASLYIDAAGEIKGVQKMVHVGQAPLFYEQDYFIYDHPSESVYKVTGVRGSGKTVISATVLGSGGGFGYTKEKNNEFFDIGVAVETMI